MSLKDIINKMPIVYTLAYGVTIEENCGVYEVKKYGTLIGKYSSLRQAMDSTL